MTSLAQMLREVQTHPDRVEPKDFAPAMEAALAGDIGTEAFQTLGHRCLKVHGDATLTKRELMDFCDIVFETKESYPRYVREWWLLGAMVSVLFARINPRSRRRS